MKKYAVKKSIKVKILSRALLCIFLLAVVLGFLSFEFSKRRIAAMLGDSIKGISATIASFVSPDDISFILQNSDKIKDIVAYERQITLKASPYFNRTLPGGDSKTLYEKYVKLLSDVKRDNKIDSPISIFVTSGNRLLSVMSSEQRFLIGQNYTIRPEALKASSSGLAQATNIYKDKDGTWISAYAPGGYLPMENRRIIVEVNYKIDSYLRKLHEELALIVIICIAGFVFAGFLSYLLVMDLASSIKKLNDAAMELEAENYDKHIDIKSNDEIGHLAKTFELLRISIKKKIDELKLSLAREKKAHLESVVVLTNAIEARDSYTKEHVSRVEGYARLIGKAMHLSRDEMIQLRYSCFLHDVGKIYIDDALLKKGTLTAKDFEEIKKHSERGAKIIEGIQFLTETKEAVLYHQERYDGKGYPRGLKGKAIPILARIVAVADAFDAMTTDRPYKHKMSFKEAFSEIEKNSGTQFDPDVCAAFLQYRDTIEDIAKKHFADIDE